MPEVGRDEDVTDLLVRIRAAVDVGEWLADLARSIDGAGVVSSQAYPGRRQSLNIVANLDEFFFMPYFFFRCFSSSRYT